MLHSGLMEHTTCVYVCVYLTALLFGALLCFCSVSYSLLLLHVLDLATLPYRLRSGDVVAVFGPPSSELHLFLVCMEDWNWLNRWCEARATVRDAQKVIAQFLLSGDHLSAKQHSFPAHNQQHGSHETQMNIRAHTFIWWKYGFVSDLAHSFGPAAALLALIPKSPIMWKKMFRFFLLFMHRSHFWWIAKNAAQLPCSQSLLPWSLGVSRYMTARNNWY